jgi:LuxR family transcriptional regulator, maltose regulon positive regulatory protein
VSGDLDALPGLPLTQHQRRILDLVADGHTDEAIGQRLYMTVNTVKTQLRRIRTKLGARNRAHAVHLGHAANLLTRGAPAVRRAVPARRAGTA